MFKIITHAALFAIGIVCFGATIAGGATASGARGHGSGSDFGAAVRIPGALRSVRPFGPAWNRGSAVRTLGLGAFYGGSAYYENMDNDEQLYERMNSDDQGQDGRNCRLERRVFEDLYLRRVRSVAVCD